MEIKTYEVEVYMDNDIFSTITVRALDEDSAVIKATEVATWEVTQILDVREVEE